MVRRLPTALLTSLLLVLTAGVDGCYSPTLPLPPPARDGLTVSSPDADGFVVVLGEPGSMDPGEQAVILNMNTHYGWIIPVDDDGGFEAIVIAEIGDWLSIQRRFGDEIGQAISIEVPEP